MKLSLLTLPVKLGGFILTIPSEHLLVEYRDLYANENMKDTGCELLVVLGRGSDRQGCIALGAKLTEERSTAMKKQLLVLSAELELSSRDIPTRPLRRS